jgi:hypothetical protein
MLHAQQCLLTMLSLCWCVSRVLALLNFAACTMQLGLGRSRPLKAAVPPEAWFRHHSRKVFTRWPASGSSIGCRTHHAYIADMSQNASSSSSIAFNASQYTTAEELLVAHQRWQAQVLQEAMQASAAGRPFVPPKAVLLKPYQTGWGNRLLPIATGGDLSVCLGRVQITCVHVMLPVVGCSRQLAAGSVFAVLCVSCNSSNVTSAGVQSHAAHPTAQLSSSHESQ